MMNIKTLLFSLLAVFLLAACNKGADPIPINPNQLADDIVRIEAYLDANGLTAQKTASGLHYIIEEEGIGDEFPEADSDVIIYYKGYLLDGTVFDQQNTDGDPATFNLQNLIVGWAEGIPLFKKGGKGTLLLPSGLAYGTSGSGTTIAPNTPIAFDIELVNFN